ncbi:MAG TPA: carbamoyltransferase C-terminal domain-containing protein [Pyrinomonadaceae bacterium]
MYILGVNSGRHDAAAAIVKDGRIVVMLEQERLSRRKRAFGELPTGAVEACLNAAGITVDDLSAVAVGWDERLRKSIAGCAFDEDEFVRWLLPIQQFPRKRKPKIAYIPHHIAHAASSFGTSGFAESIVLVIDGNGETNSTTVGLVRESKLHVLATWDITQSLGNFYGEAAEWAGFTIWDGGKLMGLASYGTPGQKMPLSTKGGQYAFDDIRRPHPRVKRHILQQRVFLKKWFSKSSMPSYPNPGGDVMNYVDFAASAQAALEDAVLGLVQHWCEATGISRLALAGGVGLNCTLNGKLLTAGMLTDLHVPPVTNDAGVSLGAALAAHYEGGNGWDSPCRLDHAYWQPGFEDREVEQAIATAGVRTSHLPLADLCLRTANLLASGRFVGWFQGRGEIGARALGARSILADPRRRDNLEALNRVKGREAWRPLAPSVLAEHAREFFQFDAPRAADFMLAAFPVTPKAKRLIPAAVHVNGTARPQVVRRETNPRFWSLISAFNTLTGVPAVINTSFNLAGEPIVYDAKDAISVFKRSGLDALVLENFLLEK